VRKSRKQKRMRQMSRKQMMGTFLKSCTQMMRKLKSSMQMMKR